MPAMEAVRKNCCWKYLAPNAMHPLTRIASNVPYNIANMYGPFVTSDLTVAITPARPSA